jgi:hypothetical protein
MNVREAMKVFKQNSWNVENFEDPGDALLYGDSKNSNCNSKFMDYLETLKSDNEEDNDEEDVKKEPKEMTLLEKLSQRSDAGLLADKFTNFLKTNSLQK